MFHSQYHFVATVIHIQSLRNQDVYIYTRHSQYGNAGFATAIKRIGSAVKAACQGRLPAYHFGHACHRFIKENAETLLVASKETGLEVNSDKTKYMVMSRDHNAGRSHSMKIVNSSFERVEEFKCLGTTLTNQNSIQEEIKSRVKSGKVCYHSVRNLLSPNFLSINLKNKIYITIICLLFCTGVKLGRSHRGRNVG